MAPRGARGHQVGSNADDDMLTLRARAAVARVKHWWGRRTRDGKTGAWCYLCHEFMATWSGSYPMTDQAKALVELHRTSHLQMTLEGATPTPHEDT